MQEEMKDFETTYRSLIDSAPDSIVIINSEGKVVYINEALAKAVDMSAKDIHGFSFQDFFSEPEKAREVYASVFSEGSVLDAPLTFRSKKGNLAEVLFSGSVYKDKSGNKNVIGLMVVPRDRSAQKTGDKGLAEGGTGGNKVKVLVVEDVVLNQLLMKTMVREFGYETDMANNGRIAIEKLQRGSYDIVLMDLQMPEMDGYETAEHIRSKMHSKIPIIALTANASTADIERSRAVGMNDYVEKPIDEKLLHNKMVKYLKSGSAERGDENENIGAEKKPTRFSNLDYLRQRTKNNSEMMTEMIETYLEETPALINKMKESVDNIDWESLAAAAHSLIPSFKIMGVSKDYESMARKIQDYAVKTEGSSEINDLVQKLDRVTAQVCDELRNELKSIKELVH